MKIVIDIDEHIYEQVMADSEVYVLDNEVDRILIENAIFEGTPLPEHHGRLIECEPIYDKLIRSYRADKKDYPEIGKDYRVGLSNAIDLLIKAPTIIEADKENDDEKE